MEAPEGISGCFYFFEVKIVNLFGMDERTAVYVGDRWNHKAPLQLRVSQPQRNRWPSSFLINLVSYQFVSQYTEYEVYRNVVLLKNPSEFLISA